MLAVLLLLAPPALAAGPAAGAPPAPKLFSLQEAIQAALKIDPDMDQAQKQLRQKGYEFQQAVQAINQQTAKDAGSFAEPRNLSQDLAIALKIPQAEKNWKAARDSLTSTERKTAYEVEKIYRAAMHNGVLAERAQRRLNDENAALRDIRTKRKFLLAADEDVQKQEDKVKQAESDLKQAELAYKASKLELSDRTGKSLDSGFAFHLDPAYAVLTQDTLWRMVETAEKTDYNLGQAVDTRKFDDFKVQATRELYTRKFGPADMKIIDAVGANEAGFDYDQFMAEYETFLAQIKQEWQGFVFLIGIPLPKSIFQGKYDGMRYFDDVVYSLPVSMLELEKASLQENKAREQLITQVKTAYVNAKQVEETYAQALKNRDAAELALKEGALKNRMGLLGEDALQQLQNDAADKQNAAEDARSSYESTLLDLDYQTSGGLRPFFRNGTLPYQQIDSGLDPFVQPGAQPKPQGTWELASVAGNVTARFTVKVDKALGADAYALETADGKMIGEISGIDAPIVHLAFLFHPTDQLKVVFYKNKDIIAEGVPEGYGPSGQLDITPKSQKGE